MSLSTILKPFHWFSKPEPGPVPERLLTARRERSLKGLHLAISMEVKNSPWGGSNQFTASFKEYFEHKGAIVSSHLNGPADLIVLVDPRTWTGTFTHKEILRYKRANPHVRVLHRINECDKRKGTWTMDRLLAKANRCADHTVFISEWLRDYFAERWFDRSQAHTCIRNGADETIFHSRGQQPWDGQGPLRFVTHHWGDHWMKGFDIYTRFDELMGDSDFRSRYELTVVGRWPKGVHFRHVKTVAPLSGPPLADELRKHHVYLTASRWEPCGMHHIEGALCGLPILYINEGGGIPECCQGFGIEFTTKTFESALEQFRQEYSQHRAAMANYRLTATHSMQQYERVILQMLMSTGS